MRNNRGKKAFTIIELVIVIAVIAILAAVLIPTFIGVVNRAKESNDILLIRNLNTALKVDGKDHPTMQSALDAADDAGFDIQKINKNSQTDNEIIWDSVNDVFCYLVNKTTVEKDNIQYIPDQQVKTPVENVKLYQYWRITDDIALAQNGPCSAYYIGPATTVTTKVGFDAGTKTDITSVEYVGAGSPQDVVIRTNGGSLTVDAGTDDVAHYGWTESLAVTAVREAHCYHEFGFVGSFASFGSGKFVAESGAGFHQTRSEIDGLLSGDGKSFDLDNGEKYGVHYYVDGVCVTCGDPEVAVSDKNGLVAGYFYKDNELFTGTESGYEFKNGMLVINNVTGVDGDDGTVYHYTIDADENYLTDKVILDTQSMSENISGYVFGGSGFGGYGFEIANLTDKQIEISSISADSIVGSRLKGGFTETEIEKLREANALPKITKSTDFLAYLETIKDLNDGTTPTAAKYVELYNAGELTGRTFTSYLKNKYGVSANGSLFAIYNSNEYFRNMVTNTILHQFYPDDYWTDSDFDGLIAGSSTGESHVEPELIEFIFDIQYNHSIAYTFHKDISSMDSDNTPDDIWALYYSINGGDSKIFGKQGANWIDLVNASGDFTSHLYNYAALDSGEVPTDVFTTSADGKTISGSIWMWWHSYLANNAYNGVDDDLPALEIILSVS